MTDFERFVGVWELEGIEDEEKIFIEGKWDGGSIRAAPVGFEQPVGLLIYLESGVMSANFCGTSRIPFLREFSPSPSELAAAGAAYGGYSGRWDLDEARREVLHHVETGFVPNRVGRTIRRSYSFEENLLHLRPLPLSTLDAAPNRVLRWKRRPARKP